MEIKELYDLYKKSYKVVKDTRDDVNNAIYFSLKGENFDGNKYCEDAINNGAEFCISDALNNSGKEIKPVLSGERNNGKNEEIFEIDQLPQGFYFLRITTDDRFEVMPFVKE